MCRIFFWCGFFGYLRIINKDSQNFRENVKKNLHSQRPRPIRPPPPLALPVVSGRSILCNFFTCTYKYICFLKQEKSEMDDFEEEQKLVH